jgi:DNA-binding IclR family transcriptional regulator
MAFHGVNRVPGTGMPKLASKAIEAGRAPAAGGNGGVAAVSRALHLLDAFTVEQPLLGLAELSRLAGMHKTTTLRLARTLAASRYLVQQGDGHWRLGPAAGSLGSRYQASFDVNDSVEPMLRELSHATGESASFYVREGDQRVCMVRVEGPMAIRYHVRMGALLPLDRGAPGRVILAYSGEPGEPYEEIRRKGYSITIGEREREVASVAAPVFGPNWRLLGSMAISGPASRLSHKKLLKHAETVRTTANRLSYALGGGRKVHAIAQRTRASP